jgi:hypothetical protein
MTCILQAIYIMIIIIKLEKRSKPGSQKAPQQTEKGE